MNKPESTTQAIKRVFHNALANATERNFRQIAQPDSPHARGYAQGQVDALVPLVGLVDALDVAWTRADFQRIGATGGAKATHTLTRRQARRMLRARWGGIKRKRRPARRAIGGGQHTDQGGKTPTADA